MGATPYPIATLIDIGEVSQSLALVNNIKQKAFKGGTIDDRIPLLIFLVRRTLEYAYETAPLADNTASIGNYLYALCRRYVTAALAALGQGAGGIIIDPGSGQPINLRWVTMSFRVGDAGAPVLDGEQQFVISLTNILSDSASFGFSNAAPLPRTGTVPVGQQTYVPTYTQSNMTITLAQPVIDGEQYTLSFGRSAAGSSFNPPSVVLPTPYQEGKFLSNDGTNLVWNDTIITITSSDFELDGVTYINTTLAYHSYTVRLENIGGVLWESGVNYTPILSGGFTVIEPGFDANTQDITITIILTGA